MDIQTKRVYEAPDPEDGTRVLVDRLWPRGVSKEDAALDDWLQSVAPSDELREWFDHDLGRWDGFVSRYHEELAEKSEDTDHLHSIATEDRLTLLYAASDTEHNNAVVLKSFLENQDFEG